MEERETASHLQKKVPETEPCYQGSWCGRYRRRGGREPKSETGKGLGLVMMADWNGSWLRNTFLPRQPTAC